MNVLAIETSTDACSVALSVSGTIVEDHRVLVRGHHRELLPMIEGLLGNAGVAPRAVRGIVLSAGPGSFTGLRIGASVAQGLAFAAGCPIAAVSSLHVLAHAVGAEDRAIVATQPARPGEVYVGVYRRRDGVWTIELRDRVLALSNAARELAVDAGSLIAGRGAAALATALGTSPDVSDVELPRAASALALGWKLLEGGRGVEPGHLELNYVTDESGWRKA